MLQTLAARLLMVVAAFGASIITARTLGPTGRGNYAFIVTLTALVVQIGNLGLQSSNTYIVAGRPETLRPLLANSVWLSLIAGLSGGAVAVAIVTATNLFPKSPERYLWFAVALAPASMFFLLGTNLLIGTRRILAFNVYEAGSALVALLVFSGAALAGFGVAGFLGASVAAWWAIGLALLVLLRRLAPGSLRFSREIFESGVRFATKAYLIALLGFVVLRANFFALARLAHTDQLGYFSVAAQVADVLTLVPTSAAVILFPSLVQNRTGSWSSTVRTANEVGVILLGLCAVTAVFASPLVRLAYGAPFAPAVPILRSMLPGVLALGITSVFSQHIAAMGLPKRMIAIWAAGVLAVIALGQVLIPSYGGIGAGIAYSSTYLLMLALVVGFAVMLRGGVTPPTSADADLEAAT